MASLSIATGSGKILELSVYFLGKIVTSDVRKVSLTALRSYIRYDFGKKTKIRLTIDGLSFGYHSSSNKKIPYEFVALKDIICIETDERNQNVLLCSVAVKSQKEELIVFRARDRKSAQRFIDCFRLVASGNAIRSLFNDTNDVLSVAKSPRRNYRIGYLNDGRCDLELSCRNKPPAILHGTDDTDNDIALEMFENGADFRRKLAATTSVNYKNSEIHMEKKPSVLVHNVQTHVHHCSSLPLSPKEGGTFGVKSYCVRDPVVKRLNGTIANNVYCQTNTFPVKSIHVQRSNQNGFSNGTKHTPVSNSLLSRKSDTDIPNGKIPGKSFLSRSRTFQDGRLHKDSFRRQLNDLTSEVKQIKQILGSNSQIYVNGYDRTGVVSSNHPKSVSDDAHHTVSSGISSMEGSEAWKRSNSKVAWSPTLEDVAPVSAYSKGYLNNGVDEDQMNQMHEKTRYINQPNTSTAKLTQSFDNFEAENKRKYQQRPGVVKYYLKRHNDRNVCSDTDDDIPRHTSESAENNRSIYRASSFEVNGTGNHSAGQGGRAAPVYRSIVLVGRQGEVRGFMSSKDISRSLDNFMLFNRPKYTYNDLGML